MKEVKVAVRKFEDADAEAVANHWLWFHIKLLGQ